MSGIPAVRYRFFLFYRPARSLYDFNNIIRVCGYMMTTNGISEFTTIIIIIIMHAVRVFYAGKRSPTILW